MLAGSGDHFEAMAMLCCKKQTNKEVNTAYNNKATARLMAIQHSYVTTLT